MIMEKEYVFPEIVILDILSEGMLCSSNEVLNEEDGNGEFN